ncbi:ATP-binding protein [uncultured Desulfuromusa sp.]|uniref:sensor histidine kinase n=1 Tax=uncultured Desulfuromusa sp. TaxID=219183 RepID=UPI002AA79211|nr:ATP-binding protein [uncultured Desulfuromusa sp.]
MKPDYRIITIALLIVIISWLHYSTTIHAYHYHDIYRRLYYLPIVLAGLWFRLRGGIGVAVLVSLIYIPHILLQWGQQGNLPLEQYLELVLYNVIGSLTGYLAQKEWQQKTRYQETAQHLEDSYDQLREQTDMLIRSEQQLEKATRLSALGELSASLAHEIRNPLASIRLSSDNLRDSATNNPNETEYLDILSTEVERLNQVVEHYLSLARNGQTQQQQIDLNQTLEEVLQLISQQATSQNIELIFEKKELPPLNGEQVQLKQAFLNLALNALKAMPDGGILSISSIFDNDHLTIIFADTGHGVAADKLEEIFTPFYSTNSNGTGLGLAITRRIIESHGGRIKAEISTPGMHFCITLPAIWSEHD